ncbi:MAG: class II fumarate hydratase [Planctomycetota bacterium]|jgi:fumarate hydratase class II|nr:class II fumarate hydratase [Planctomycetota bacterium]
MRLEYDSLGPVEVPESVLYGAQTRRAELNFGISGWRLPRPFLDALARIKRSAAQVNREMGRLDPVLAQLIMQAAGEVLDGQHAEDFPLDVFQTGSATSTNMNMNEVIANRAIQLAGGVPGSKKPVHPNDHVNLGQSSNDLAPTAAHLAAASEIHHNLLPALTELQAALSVKAQLFLPVVKIGRTHLQDAVPIRLGQVFSGYADQVHQAKERITIASGRLLPLALGGTAVGTGLNAAPGFAARVIAILAEETGLAFREAENHFSAQAAMDEYVALAGCLKSVALVMVKIANDIRFLASGPRCGLGELRLPSLQPGSSIMPGKVNPVLCEALIQAASFVVAGEAGVTFAASSLANFELAVAWPYSTWQVLEMLRILASAIRQFTSRLVEGLEAEKEHCQSICEASLALCTGLVPEIGYDQAALIAKKAAESGRTIKEVAAEETGWPEDKLAGLIDPLAMTGVS